MMLKAKKLRAPLSSILRRTPLTSYSTTSRLSPTYQTSHHLATSNPQNPAPSSSTTTVVADINHHFVGYPFKISGNSFCSQSSQKINTNRCWNCNAEPQSAPFLVCDSCRTIQPVDHSVNYFEIFGLEKKYEIEDRNLEGKYKDWQKKLHPDLVHSKSEKEREFAAEQSARVIDAYRTLSNSLARAIYIMKLEGVDVDEEETISEPELLSEIMEIREAVEEAPDSQALNEIKSLMQEKLQHWANSFANAFHSLKFEEAVTCIRRMTYYDRVNEEIVKRL